MKCATGKFARNALPIALGLGLLSCGCLSTSVSSERIWKETLIEDESTDPPAMALINPEIDYAATVPSLRLSVTGSIRRCWREGRRHEDIEVKWQRRWDPVSWPSWPSPDMPLTRRLGIFRWTSDLFGGIDGGVEVTSSEGLYPLTQEILKDNRHVIRFEAAPPFKSDGNLESIVLPYTLSDEWAASWGNTFYFACYSVYTVGLGPFFFLPCLLCDPDTELGKTAREVWVGPITLVAAPLCDACVLSADTAITGSAIALDLAKDAVVIGADIIAMGCAATADLSWKTLTLLGDGLATLGDLAWPGTVEMRTYTNAPAMPSEWKEETEQIPLKSYARYLATFTAPGYQHKAPVSEAGEVRLELIDLEKSSTNRHVHLRVSLEHDDGDTVQVEPLEVKIDLWRVRQGIIPASPRRIVY